MIAAAGLLAYAALMLGCGFPALARASWPDRAPRLAIAAWLALAWSAAASVALGGVALMVPTARVSGGIAWLLAACETALRTRYAHPGGAVPDTAGAALAAAVTLRMAWSAAVTLCATARVGRRHRRRLRIAGRPDTRLGAVIVDHGEPAAYCLPGARRPVVLTSAAVRLLDDRQLTAVLAHERAHQAGRHHLLVALAAIPAAAFPFLPALRHARHEVARLAELAADDAAAARAPRLALAEALLALGTAPQGTGALGAGGSTAAARVRRLIAAPDPLTRAATALGAIAVTGLVAFPVVLIASPAITILGLGYCPLPRLPPPAKCRHAEGSRPLMADSPRASSAAAPLMARDSARLSACAPPGRKAAAEPQCTAPNVSARLRSGVGRQPRKPPLRAVCRLPRACPAAARALALGYLRA